MQPLISVVSPVYKAENIVEELVMRITENVKSITEDFEIKLPCIKEQERIVSILDKFDVIVNDLSNGLPAEIEARQRQYEHYRDKLLTFKEKN